MVKVKVDEATNSQLDWLTASCEGAYGLHVDDECFLRVQFDGDEEYLGNLSYTSDWNLMGPIIEREKLTVWFVPENDPYPIEGGPWTSFLPNSEVAYTGLTPLIAAARCYVVSKLGEEVEIPEELYG